MAPPYSSAPSPGPRALAWLRFSPEVRDGASATVREAMAGHTVPVDRQSTTRQHQQHAEAPPDMVDGDQKHR